jgi:hypothetical protein
MLGEVSLDNAASMIAYPGLLAASFIPGANTVITKLHDSICSTGTKDIAEMQNTSSCHSNVDTGVGVIITAGLAFLAYTMFFQGKR